MPLCALKWSVTAHEGLNVRTCELLKRANLRSERLCFLWYLKFSEKIDLGKHKKHNPSAPRGDYNHETRAGILTWHWYQRTSHYTSYTKINPMCQVQNDQISVTRFEDVLSTSWSHIPESMCTLWSTLSCYSVHLLIIHGRFNTELKQKQGSDAGHKEQPVCTPLPVSLCYSAAVAFLEAELIIFSCCWSWDFTAPWE